MKLFGVGSQSFPIFKVFGGLKFWVKVIIKVNVPIDLRLFYGISDPYRRGLPAFKKCRPLWLAKEEKLLAEVVSNC